MNSRILASFLAMCLISLIPMSASAHTLVTDGQTGVLLHADPNDAPQAGAPSKLELIVDDSSQHFKVSDCTCVVSVIQGGKTIFLNSNAGVVHSADNTTLDQIFTFPEAGIYTVKLSATPISNNTFQPVHVSFNLRVEPAAATSAGPLQRSGYLVLGGGAAGIVLLILHDVETVLRRRKR
jgi:hypothetical protein